MVSVIQKHKIENLLLDLGFAKEDFELLTTTIQYHLEGMGMLEIYQRIGIERGGKSKRIEKALHNAILQAWQHQSPMMRDMFFGYLIQQCPSNQIAIEIIGRKVEDYEQRKSTNISGY